MAKQRRRDANGHRHRQSNAQVLRQEDICHLCGKPVDKTLRWPHPMSPVVDHVIPFARGGHPYARSNKALAHRICNGIKSDKLPTKTTRTAPAPTSQDW